MPSEFRVPIDLAGELVFFRSKNQKLANAIGHWLYINFQIYQISALISENSQINSAFLKISFSSMIIMHAGHRG